MNRKTSFSVIIPSYNEGEDIRLAIESVIAQDYAPEEILVIDDSLDNTPELVREYGPQGVELLSGPARGCCEARNLGMKSSKGDVVVLLNADVILPKNFISRIAQHYQAGADYVLVESEVKNQENIYARFIEMQHRKEVAELQDDAEWTEGFSCRKEAAREIGYIPGNFDKRFCRDWVLGKRLGEAGYKKVVDRSILVTHKAPDNFKEFWKVRKTRGRFGALMQRYLHEKSLVYLFFKFIAKDFLFLVKFLTIFPGAWMAFRIARWSEKSAKDLLPFWLLLFVQEYARILGEWEGFIKSIF